VDNEIKKPDEDIKSKKVTCTWNEKVNCENCDLKEKIDCKWKRSLLLRFMLIASPALIFIAIGLIYSGIILGEWWLLGAVIGYYVAFFVVETRILCSHCPYYSEEGMILHCPANHGFIKFFRYHPEPLSTIEEILVILGFALFAIVTFAAMCYSIIKFGLSKSQYNENVLITFLVIHSLTLVSIGIFLVLLIAKICTRCVNFSCPWNSVPKEIVDSYLQNNDYMKEAWLKAGYKIDEDD
jgi:hypothetical protein